MVCLKPARLRVRTAELRPRKLRRVPPTSLPAPTGWGSFACGCCSSFGPFRSPGCHPQGSSPCGCSSSFRQFRPAGRRSPASETAASNPCPPPHLQVSSMHRRTTGPRRQFRNSGWRMIQTPTEHARAQDRSKTAGNSRCAPGPNTRRRGNSSGICRFNSPVFPSGPFCPPLDTWQVSLDKETPLCNAGRPAKLTVAVSLVLTAHSRSRA